jgi:hypothetical protein
MIPRQGARRLDVAFCAKGLCVGWPPGFADDRLLRTPRGLNNGRHDTPTVQRLRSGTVLKLRRMT